MDMSTNTSLANNLNPPITAATTTTPTATTVASAVHGESQVPQAFVAGLESTVDLTMDIDGWFVIVTPAGVYIFVLLVTQAGAHSLRADATAPASSARRVRDGGGVITAISGLLFLPTILLMSGAAVVGHNTTTTAVLDPFGGGAAICILFVAAVVEIVAAVIEAFGTILTSPPYTEATGSSSNLDWSKCFELVARCFAFLAIALFLIGAGSLAFEDASVGVGSALDVSPLVK